MSSVYEFSAEDKTRANDVIEDNLGIMPIMKYSRDMEVAAADPTKGKHRKFGIQYQFASFEPLESSAIETLTQEWKRTGFELVEHGSLKPDSELELGQINSAKSEAQLAAAKWAKLKSLQDFFVTNLLVRKLPQP